MLKAPAAAAGWDVAEGAAGDVSVEDGQVGPAAELDLKDLERLGEGRNAQVTGPAMVAGWGRAAPKAAARAAQVVEERAVGEQAEAAGGPEVHVAPNPVRGAGDPPRADLPKRAEAGAARAGPG